LENSKLAKIDKNRVTAACPEENCKRKFRKTGHAAVTGLNFPFLGKSQKVVKFGKVYSQLQRGLQSHNENLLLLVPK